MKVSIKELQLIYNLINEKLILLGFEEVELSTDYYWQITSDERENLNKDPNLCVGSLEDDWAELKKVILNKQVTVVDLDRFANILIAVGEKISKSDKPWLLTE